MQQVQQPFTGLKVLAVARVFAAPFAAYQLALHGAEVITVEDPVKGDSTRTAGGSHAKKLTEAKMGVGYLAHASNKKSLTLNLKEPRAQAIFKQMIKDTDVLIENLRTGDMDRFGLGYEAMQAINPRLIYCSLTGYGQTGPKRRDAAIDVVIQAASGMMSVTGSPQSGPMKVGPTVVDYASGFSLALAITTALYQRERTGEGQRIDVSMLETALISMSAVVSDVQNAGLETKLNGNRTSANRPISNSLMCSDTHIVVAASSDLRRRRFLTGIGRMDMLDEARFATPDLMRENADAMYEEIEKTLKSRTAQEWEDILNEAGVPCMRVYKIKEIVEHPQIKERKLYHTFEHVPGIDKQVTVPLAPYKLSKGPAIAHSVPARLGQHTDEILKGLGFDAAQIQEMRQAGVV